MRVLLGIGVFAFAACADPPKAKIATAEVAESQRTEPGAAQEVAPPSDPSSADPEPAEPVEAAGGVEPPTPTPASVAGDGDAPSEALPTPSEDAAPTDTPPAAAPTLVETPVEAVPVVRPWREVMSPTEPIAFQGTTSGILGRGVDDFYDVDENGELVARAQIEAPPGETVLGVWPDNAWSIQRIVKEESDGRTMDVYRSFRLMRLRGNRRWVPQAYLGEQRVEDEEQDFFVGGKGGLLVLDLSITRVAGRAEDPEHYDTSGELLGAFESARGAVFTANGVRAEDAVFVSRACAPENTECDPVRSKLPHGRYWEFTTSVPRAKYSISTFARTTVGKVGAPPADYLLSFGGDAWKLESLGASPGGMWPAKDGGLWILADAKLLHRSSAGSWESVALPEGLGAVSAGMRRDASELWISGTREGKPLIYAVAATPAPPAVEG